MDVQTTAVTLVLIGVCIAPFYFMNRKNLRYRKIVLKNLSAFASKNSCIVEETDVWGESVIAIDKSNQKLIYSGHATNNGEFKIIDLSEVSSCAILKSDDDHGRIKKLALHLALGTKSNAFIEFYSNDRLMPINNELELINKWEKIINNNLKKLD